jgi:L,D-peptidoglycan transpeptidase YkuD (ErfK/YbiS/YcfS/YnhG family)
MIIVKKHGYLKYKNFKFRCSLGKAGVKKKMTDGDNITPKGTFKLLRVFYRQDKVKKIKTKLKTTIIKKNFGWCDDPKSIFYNKLIKLPFKESHEKLYRADNIYDLFVVLNYNINPIIKNKGSAIFIHIAKRSFNKTAGCIALTKKDLLTLLANIKKNTRIKIQ